MTGRDAKRSLSRGIAIASFSLVCACESLIGASFDDARLKPDRAAGGSFGNSAGKGGTADAGDAGEGGGGTGPSVASSGKGVGGHSGAFVGAAGESGGSAGAEESCVDAVPIIFSDLSLDAEADPFPTAFPREVPANLLVSGVGYVIGRGPTCFGAKISSNVLVFATECPFTPETTRIRTVIRQATGELGTFDMPMVRLIPGSVFSYAYIDPVESNRFAAWSSRAPLPDEPVTIVRLDKDALRVAHGSLSSKLFDAAAGPRRPTTATALAFGTDAHLVALCSIDTCGALSRCVSLESSQWDNARNLFAEQALLFDDLNKDSRADAVAISLRQIQGYQSNGLSFAEKVAYLQFEIMGANASAVGDVTADGRADLVIVGGNGISVYSNNGDGKFEIPPIAVTAESTPTRMARVGHVVPQGHGELVLLQENRVVVVRNVGANSALEAWYEKPPPGIMTFEVRDVTGDHLDDVLLGFADHVAVLRSTGSSFAPPETWLSDVTVTAPGWFFADVTGDGKADAIRIDIFQSEVYPSNGSAFEPSAQPWNPIAIAELGNYFADVTGDGKADAIVQNLNSVLVFRSTGTGFGPMERWTSGEYYGGGF